MDPTLHRILDLLKERSGGDGDSMINSSKKTSQNFHIVKMPSLEVDEIEDFKIAFESSFIFEGGPIPSYDSRWLTLPSETHNSINRNNVTPSNSSLNGGGGGGGGTRKRPMTPKNGETPKKAKTTTINTTSIVHTSFHAKR